MTAIIYRSENRLTEKVINSSRAAPLLSGDARIQTRDVWLQS